MLIKKGFVLLIILLFTAFPSYALSESEISAKAAVVMDSETKTVLFEKSADLKLSMASTTKIMTSLIAIESGKLNFPVTASRNILVDGTSIGISKGDCFSLSTLVHAMMLESGNDAAVLTAEYLAGSEKDFSLMMNDKAKLLGMENTNFVTASGLDSENHYSTAYDMALLASDAINNPIFRSISKKQTYKAEYMHPDTAVTYSNHNKLLRMYDGTIGIKTGFTKKSGRCLVSACEKNGRTLVTVTLNAPDDWNDHIKMYDFCFDTSVKTKVNLSCPDSISVYGGTKNRLKISVPEPVTYESDVEFRYEVILPSFIYAPVSEGEIVGKLILYSDGVAVSYQPILSCEEIPASEGKDYINSDFNFKFKYILQKLLRG